MQDEIDEAENEVVLAEQEALEEPFDYEDRVYEEWLERELFGGSQDET